MPMSYKEVFGMFFKGAGFFSVMMFYFTVLLIVFYGFYTLNLYMIKWEDENAALEERQRRIDAVKKRKAARRAEKEKIEKEL